MRDIILIPFALFYLFVVGLLFVYGINFFYLTYLSLQRKNPAIKPLPKTWPAVTVQLPIFNERYVAQRLVESALQLDYPRDRLEVQVLDDSDDDTREIIADIVRTRRAEGFNIVHIHRTDRTGYKAGALADGLSQAQGEFLALFDADFIPQSDFLKATIPSFSDPRIAFVQARWGHVNRDYSLLTFLQSLAIDAHFMVEQFARFRGGYWFNFNGTAGVWRKAAIEDAGGWKADTLTEDLDLSYRAFLKGWQAEYLRDVVVPAELPVSFSAYRRQQKRWAQGSLECAIRLVPEVWAMPLTFGQKIEATLHLTGYAVHLLLFTLVLLYPAIILISQDFSGLISLFGIAAMFNLTAFAPTIFFLAAQKQLGDRWWRKVPTILFITALGAGMMLNTVRAALQIYSKKKAVFERTPKFGIFRRGDEWLDKSYQLKLDTLVYFEFFLGLINVFTVIFGLRTGNWLISVYAAIFAVGLFFVAFFSAAQSVTLWRLGFKHRSRNNR